jgi:hypothetical protein
LSFVFLLLSYFFASTCYQGESDVEDDLLFELEMEWFIAHAKRLNVKRK